MPSVLPELVTCSTAECQLRRKVTGVSDSLKIYTVSLCFKYNSKALCIALGTLVAFRRSRKPAVYGPSEMVGIKPKSTVGDTADAVLYLASVLRIAIGID